MPESDLMWLTDLRRLPIRPSEGPESNSPLRERNDEVEEDVPYWLRLVMTTNASVLMSLNVNAASIVMEAVEPVAILNEFLASVYIMNNLCTESDGAKHSRTLRCTGLSVAAATDDVKVDSYGYEVLTQHRKTTERKIAKSPSSPKISALGQSVTYNLTTETLQSVHQRSWCHSLLTCGQPQTDIFCEAVIRPLWDRCETLFESTASGFAAGDNDHLPLSPFSTYMMVSQAIRTEIDRRTAQEETIEELASSDISRNRVEYQEWLANEDRRAKGIDNFPLDDTLIFSV